MSQHLEEQLPFRFHVNLRVSSGSITPDEVSTALDLMPYDSILKGEKYDIRETYGITGLPEEVRAEDHEWAASFEPLTSAETLSECLSRVANHLAKHSIELSKLSESADVQLSIYAYPGSVPDPIDWNIMTRIRACGVVGLQISLAPRLETTRPSNARPKNHV